MQLKNKQDKQESDFTTIDWQPPGFCERAAIDAASSEIEDEGEVEVEVEVEDSETAPRTSGEEKQR